MSSRVKRPLDIHLQHVGDNQLCLSDLCVPVLNLSATELKHERLNNTTRITKTELTYAQLKSIKLIPVADRSQAEGLAGRSRVCVRTICIVLYVLGPAD